jgi:hypothetical protein
MEKQHDERKRTDASKKDARESENLHRIDVSNVTPIEPNIENYEQHRYEMQVAKQDSDSEEEENETRNMYRQMEQQNKILHHDIGTSMTHVVLCNKI